LITSLGSLVQGEQATRLMCSLFKASDVQQGKLLSSATRPVDGADYEFKALLIALSRQARHRLLEVIIGGSSQRNNQRTQFQFVVTNSFLLFSRSVALLALKQPIRKSENSILACIFALRLWP